jgi:hypothetical protein
VPPLVRYLLAYGIYVAFLHVVKGPWQAGRTTPGRAFDGWTITHLVWGAISRAFGLSWSTVTMLGVVNEIGELAVHRYRPDLVWGYPETRANRLLDVLATSAGWFLR